MADYCWIYGVIHFTSPVGWLPVHRDQLRAQRLVTSMGKLYLFLSLPRGLREDMPPIDGSSTGGGSASFHGPVRNPYNFGGRQVAGSQRAYSLGWDIQTDGSRYRLMPPLRRRHNNWPLTVIFYACVGRRELKIRVIGQGRCLGLQLARMITRLVWLRSLTEGSSFSSCFERL